jgi:phospholipase C
MSGNLPLSRRGLITGASALAAGAAVAPTASFARPKLPNPKDSGLDHIVMVCMENRSFDHFFGWLPGADGRTAGLSYKDDEGKSHSTHHLTMRLGCGFNDPSHSFSGGRTQFNGGECDGFRKGDNDDFALGYYLEQDLPLYGPLAKSATVYDRFFSSILGPTYPNRFYTHAAQTDRISNTMDLSDLATIWDGLNAKGVSANYYFSDLPFLGLFGPRFVNNARPMGQFFVDALAGTLPSFSYLDPFFLGEEQGGSNDDHPHADIWRGQAFLSEIIAALMQSPQWSKTALVITYDEWGGFYDHVRPPRLPDNHDTGPRGKDDHAQAGFRIPTIAFGPFARRGHVGHAVYDHSSILKMVEWRFGLKPMTKRDRSARNLAESFNFAKPNTSIPDLPIVLDPGPGLCGVTPDRSTSDGGITLPTRLTGMCLEKHDRDWHQLSESKLIRPYLKVL